MFANSTCTHPVTDGETASDVCGICGASISQEVELAAHIREQEIRQPQDRTVIIQNFFAKVNSTKRIIAPNY